MACTQTSTTLSQLPQEIIDIIIDQLPDDSLTFSSCSLVCLSFLFSIRRRMFRQVQLSTQDSDPLKLFPKCHLFGNMLTSPPSQYISNFVKELVLFTLAEPTSRHETRRSPHVKWARMSCTESLSLFLPQLNALTRITILGVGGKTGSTLPGAHHHVLQRTFRNSRNLGEIEFRQMSFYSPKVLITLLDGAQALHTLTLENVRFLELASGECAAEFRLTGLALLAMSGALQHISQWLPPSSLQTLRTLTVDIQPTDIPYLNHLLHTTSTSLRDLKLNHIGEFELDSSRILDISQLESLFLYIPSQTHLNAALKWLSFTLSQNTRIINTHSITFLISNIDHLLPDEILNAYLFDFTLSRHEMSSIRRVIFDFQDPPDLLSSRSRAEDVQKLLPRLCERRVLEIYELELCVD